MYYLPIFERKNIKILFRAELSIGINQYRSSFFSTIQIQEIFFELRSVSRVLFLGWRNWRSA